MGQREASPTFSRKTIRACLNHSDRFKNTLGPKGEDIIAEDNKSIREEKQLREKERIAADHQRANDEVQNLKNKIEQTQAKIDAFDEEHGSESELQRLKLLKK